MAAKYLPEEHAPHRIIVNYLSISAKKKANRLLHRRINLAFLRGSFLYESVTCSRYRLQKARCPTGDLVRLLFKIAGDSRFQEIFNRLAFLALCRAAQN
ncbi:hypothetical protein [Franconibacter daqui]|uniref:hypothetical protein n=1 Tax=Franconibacter daqui TaxID=2047724 RepID=UPI00166B0C97|nr:hypothetical protein [Franconibacter daqui]